MSIVDDARAIVAGVINHGVILASPEVANNRWTICQTCPLLTEHNKCQECGCLMTIKCNVAAMRCPLNPPKWESEI